MGISGWDDFEVWYFGRHEVFDGIGVDRACESSVMDMGVV